jgi:hypothetical protein
MFGLIGLLNEEEQILGAEATEHRDHMDDATRDSYNCMGRALQNNTVRVQEYRNEVQNLPSQIAELMMRALRAQRGMLHVKFMNWMADRPLQVATQAPAQAPQGPIQAQKAGIVQRQGEATAAAALGAIVPQGNPLDNLRNQGTEQLIPQRMLETMEQLLEKDPTEDLNQYRRRGANSQWTE